MTDLVERLWALIRHGRDQGMKMDDIEEAAREIERLRYRLQYMESKYGKIDWDAALSSPHRAETNEQ